MKAIVKSNNSYTREYEGIKTRSALVIAKELGRCENGEKVEVCTNKGKTIDKTLWSCEDQKYFRVCL